MELRNLISDLRPHAILIDYFDTLVERVIHPEDVKRLSAQKLANLLNGRLTPEQLYAIRARIEREICEKNLRDGLDAEFNFLVLCDRISETIEAFHPFPRSTVQQWLVNLELATECAVQRLDTNIADFLWDLRRRKIPLYVVSDFYLPRELFVQMLEHHGVAGLFEDIFVSADDLLTKRSGRRYAKLAQRLPIAGERLIMIGDNLDVDVRRARDYGLSAIHLDRRGRHREYKSLAKTFASRQVLARKVRAEVGRTRDNTASIFPELALTLYYFADRLYYALMRAGVRDVYFLSREGQFLRTLFDDYQAINALPQSGGIRTHYLEVSRRSTFLPSLRSLDEENFDTLFRQYWKISLDEFLANLGLQDIGPHLCAELGVEGRHRYDDFCKSPVLAAIRAHPLFRERYEKRRQDQHAAFCSYLKSVKGNDNGEKLTIVDVGWKGTIQDNIFAILRQGGGERCGYGSVQGFYLGLVEAGNAGPDNEKEGLVFAAVRNRSPGFECFNENRSLFEVMLAADHGSIREYARFPDGTVEVVREPFDVERVLFEEEIRPIQQRIRARFKRVCAHFLQHGCGDADLLSLVMRQHARMVFLPRRHEVNWIKKVFHVENFGVFELSRFMQAKERPGTVLQRARFSLRLLRYRSSLNLGFWPWLTIKDAGLPMLHFVYAAFRLVQIKRSSLRF